LNGSRSARSIAWPAPDAPQSLDQIAPLPARSTVLDRAAMLTTPVAETTKVAYAKPIRRSVTCALPRCHEFCAREPLLRLFWHDGCKCCRISPNVSPNIHGNWDYIVNAQTKVASKRLWTSSRKVDIKIARKVKPFATAFNRNIQKVMGGARICDVEISEKSPYL
jgi:hypothetical protein